VYEGIFRRTAVDYYRGTTDNTIEIDYDSITNANYAQTANAVTVNSPGYYRIYAQCRIVTATQSAGTIAVYVNNTAYRSLSVTDIKNLGPTHNLSCIANLNTSDTISLHIYAGNAFKIERTSDQLISPESYITIEKL
jgi:hypothetical protein